MAGFTDTNLFPKIWVGRISSLLYTRSRVLDKLQDESARLSASGDGIKVPVDSSAVTIRDYTRGQQLTVEDRQPVSVPVDLDQTKYVAFTLDRLDVRETNADYLGRGAMHTVIGLRNTMTDNIYSKMLDTVDGSGAANHVHSTHQKVITVKKDGVTGTNFGDATYRAELVDSLLDMRATAIKAGWMDSDIGAPYVIVGPEIDTALAKFLTIDKPNLGIGAIVDSAYTGGVGTPLGRIAGFNYTVDSRLGLSDSHASAGTKQFPIWFGLQGQYNTFIRNVMITEALSRPDRFEVGLKALWRWGFEPAAKFEQKGAAVITHTVTDS